MSMDFTLTCHCLFNGVGIYFQLPKGMSRPEFACILKVLAEKGTLVLRDEVVESYWRGLQQRMEGNARWDMIAPRIDPQDDRSKMRAAYLSQNRIENIVEKRPYVAFTINGITYLVEVFNPQNELCITYHGAGEPVVVLMMRGEKFETLNQKLFENPDFYSIIREIAAILSPRKIVGMTSASVARLIRSYREGKVDPATNPWSFLEQFQVMRLPKPVGDVTLNRYFKKFERWEDGWVLLQVKEGIDFIVEQRCFDAAKVLDMTAIEELYSEERCDDGR